MEFVNINYSSKCFSEDDVIAALSCHTLALSSFGAAFLGPKNCAVRKTDFVALMTGFSVYRALYFASFVWKLSSAISTLFTCRVTCTRRSLAFVDFLQI